MKNYRVEFLDEEPAILNEDDLRDLAIYYYNNSEVNEEINFDDIQNCIEFVNRVDKVTEI